MEAGRKIPAVGNKREVFLGLAKHTPGGLTKSDLMKNKSGKIVSRRKHALAIKNKIYENIRD
jgi:hypothetical protein